MTKEMKRKNPEAADSDQLDLKKVLLISLGTGTAQMDKYSAGEAAKWGIAGWLTDKGSNPLIDVFTQASVDMVDLHISSVFQTLHSEENYLRIQVSLVFRILRYACTTNARRHTHTGLNPK